MEVSETKKTNKVLLLATYCFAVACLLIGLLVPLFDGNKMLLLQLPGALNSLAGKEVIATETPFALAGAGIISLGGESFLDFGALVILLYAVVTLVAVIGVVPVALFFKKDGKVDRVIAYSVEVAAVILLSLYLVIALPMHVPDHAFKPFVQVGYNLVIALVGTVASLAVLSVSNKKKTGIIKLVLFLLSAVALLMLFPYYSIIPAIRDPFISLGESAKIFPAFFNYNINHTGSDLIAALFGPGYGESIKQLVDVNLQSSMVLGSITALLVVVNYLIDVVSLATNGKKKVLLFNVIRYGVELAAVICLIICIVAASYGMGLFLIVVGLVGVVRLVISIIRYLKALKAAKAEREAEREQTMFARPTKAPKQKAEEERYDDIIVDVPDEAEVPFVGAEPIEIDEEPVPSEDDEQLAFVEPAPEQTEVEDPYEEPLTENPDEVQIEMEETEAESEPSWGQDWNTEYENSAEPEPVEEPEDDTSVWTSEPEQPAYSEPVEEPAPTPVEEPVVESEPEQPVFSEPEEEPVVEPERPAEEPVVEPEPTPAPAPVYEYKPEPKPEPKVEPKPEPKVEQPVYRVEPTPAPAPTPVPVREYRPEPKVEPKVEPKPEPKVEAKVETKSEPVRTFTPVQRYTIGPDGELVYTIRYGGPVDEFIGKLNNDEKIEFAMTFIERNKGDIGNVPEYVIGGNNKKFFSAVFIYLGRIRGLISDGLLNKMFKELNML